MSLFTVNHQTRSKHLQLDLRRRNTLVKPVHRLRKPILLLRMLLPLMLSL
jgi:hypothetical protein